MQNYSSVVASVLRTFPVQVVPADQEEQAKAQFTRHVAWTLHQQNPNIGLLKKTGGNQVNGRSVDVILDVSDGSWADVASAVAAGPGQVRLVAVWIPKASTGGDPRPAWIQPTAAIAAEPGPLTAAVPDPEPPPEPEPDPEPMPDLVTLITNAVTLSQEPLRATLDTMAHDIAEIKRVQAEGLGGSVLGYKIRLRP